MSLVAYGNSSDEEEDEVEEPTPSHAPARVAPVAEEIQLNAAVLKLPVPETTSDEQEQEEDDEYLHKKAVPVEKPPPMPRGPVKISIPSLKDFKDLESVDTTSRGALSTCKRPTGLLNMLPKPKAEQLFTAKTSTGAANTKGQTTTRTLIPHSVAKAKKERESKPITSMAPEDTSLSIENPLSDDEEDNNSSDFFALTSREESLPQVSKNEINLMVAKRAAKIAETSAKFDQLTSPNEQQMDPSNTDAPLDHHQQAPVHEIDPDAMQHLIGGSRAKRARMENVNVIDLSHDQVMPSRDEWMRSAMASSTTATVRGELKDGPKGVAKKKHQITYLAHQAKANEAELQAMWAANRVTQRQSQSKYGW